MSGFKLIAIRPLKGCADRLRKVLKEGTVYPFFNDYVFHKEKDEQHGEIEKVTYAPSFPEDLFGLPNHKNITIHISSVVGKNGSGKSTLMELFFAAVFVIAAKTSVLEDNLATIPDGIEDIDKKINEDKEKREWFSRGATELFEEYGNTEEWKTLKEKLQKLVGSGFWKEAHKEKLKTIGKEIRDLYREVKLEIYYELETKLYRLQIGKGENAKDDINLSLATGTRKITSPKEFEFIFDDEEDFKFKTFFYSIAVSYSHYALNSLEVGDWVNSLFHKNDGYQTPLVINPMRTKGNIDINNEKKLVKQRLLANILAPLKGLKPKDSLRNFAPGKTATKLILTFNHEKMDRYAASNPKIDNGVQCLEALSQQYTGLKLDAVSPAEPYLMETREYVIHKLIKICQKYPRYYDFLKGDKFDLDPKSDFLNMIIEDNSHITFKVKQALNFLRFQLYINWDSPDEMEINIEDYANQIEKSRNELQKVTDRAILTIELIPPSFFDVKIKLDQGGFFEDMSSGEKQYIYSISSIVYHLINLNSIFKNGEQKEKVKPAEETTLERYQYLNILFDEVEQYFHPDLQRTFIGDLLAYINKVNQDLIDKIEGINILFGTHSPFILSDIPVSQTLRLDDGNIQPIPEKNTFGANIYDLLADSFFMKEGFVGSFALRKIEEVIKYVNGGKYTKETHSRHEKIAQMISDEIVSRKLKSLLADLKNQGRTEIEKLESQIQEMKERIEEIKNDKTSK